MTYRKTKGFNVKNDRRKIQRIWCEFF